ncbi:Lysophospholipase, alpha-beta hydrolase superfamily [Actinacidiphila yanglinensis]|uniref:Lysophospholipase, alpha-beta hydrolase superfamily n=1 Tax=Actinacidiphila yanglinensis TaxID=310779 RepID=A0A1H6BRE7_9ACTN|nr:alpha/beta hydrolase [Actinacidiphila yanglinensis]SEG63253.1 Lysophospholipase, alpha-beta hydrolase superfamily [Actinacidiphila yanglinensis]
MKWERAGLVGAAIGVVAAGAAAGVAIERATVGRGMRRRAQLALDAAGPYGSLRGTPGTVLAEDGTELYYETDEPPPVPEPDDQPPAPPTRPARRGWLRGRRAEPGPGAGQEADGAPRPPVTVVFSHGYCLSQDSWHFQRALLRGTVRAVYWDQRSHGRSERGRDQLAGKPATIDQLGRDLKAVLDAAAPQGPVVLVGHSMGGMTVMAFADQFPEYVRERVAGAALISTSAGKLAAVTLGLPAFGARAFRVLAPGVLRVMGRQADLVERGRRATAELFTGVIKRYSFGADDVDPAVARFAERLIEATPIDVVAEFYPAFTEHEKADALAVLDGSPVLVLAGEKDLLTPSAHSADIAERLPGAELVLVPGAGHLVLFERPEVVGPALATLIAKAADGVRAPVPQRLRDLTVPLDA